MIPRDRGDAPRPRYPWLLRVIVVVALIVLVAAIVFTAFSGRRFF